MGVNPMNQTKQNTTVKQLFPKNHEKVKSIVADENLGSRDVDELGRKVVMDEPLNQSEVRRIQKFARERAFYLNDEKAEKVRKTAKEVLN